MAGITGATVTVTQRQMVVTDKMKQISATIVIGDGVSTYPSGGIPVTPAQFGFRVDIRAMLFSDTSNSDGYIYKYDLTNNKIRIYQANYTATASGPLLEVTTAFVPAATTLKAQVEGK